MYPDPSDNLLQLYGHQAICEKVARFDAMGKKKKLRKSYKNHIMGLAGKNEVVAKPTDLQQQIPMDDGADGQYKLIRLAYYPDEEWRLQNVLGKELPSAQKPFDVSRLRRALLGITKGEIPGVRVVLALRKIS